jgi:hypothetical protein
MRIICKNGFYKFFPQQIAEVARFSAKFGVELVECEDYFTFPALEALSKFSFIRQSYGGLVGVANYCGNREEILGANGFSLYLPTQKLVLKSLIFEKINYSYSNFYFTDTLPQAYSYDENGKISGFNGFVDVDYMRFKIEKFFYESI